MRVKVGLLLRRKEKRYEEKKMGMVKGREMGIKERKRKKSLKME